MRTRVNLKKRTSVRRSRRKYRRSLHLEPLEDRRMLASDAAHVFARFEGNVTNGGEQVNITLDPADFSLASGATRVGFLVSAADGSDLNPAAPEVSDETPVLPVSRIVPSAMLTVARPIPGNPLAVAPRPSVTQESVNCSCGARA